MKAACSQPHSVGGHDTALRAALGKEPRAALEAGLAKRMALRESPISLSLAGLGLWCSRQDVDAAPLRWGIMKTMRLTACAALAAAIGILFGCGTSGNDGAIVSAGAPLISLDDAREAIEDACPGPFKNHGACGSCVAHAVDDLKGQGDITGQMGGQLVSEFAKGYCKNA